MQRIDQARQHPNFPTNQQVGWVERNARSPTNNSRNIKNTYRS